MAQHVGMRAFCGTWLFSCDGLAGRLAVELIGEPDSPEVGLAAQFTDADGRKHKVDSLKVDLHRISFIVRFAGQGQLFRGYLFTKTHDAMAGYTVRGDDRYGWFAIRSDSLLVS